MNTWQNSTSIEPMIELNIKPSKQQLRYFGITGAVILSILAAWTYFNHSIFTFSLHGETAVKTAVVLWSCSGVMLAATVIPRILLPLYITMAVVGWPIGFVISIAVMAAIYFILITPLALFFKIIGRDPLHRKFEPGAETYWVETRQRTGIEKYFRQF